MSDLSDRERFVLGALRGGDTTADEFVTTRGWYVNTWAPVFTRLRQAGLIRRTGAKRPTKHQSEAFVVEITDEGRNALA